MFQSSKLSVLHVLVHLILTVTQQGMKYYNPQSS